MSAYAAYPMVGFLVAVALVLSCGGGGSEGTHEEKPPECSSGMQKCVGDSAWECDKYYGWQEVDYCKYGCDGDVCRPAPVICDPNERWCEEVFAVKCSEDGTEKLMTEHCQAPYHCMEGECTTEGQCNPELDWYLMGDEIEDDWYSHYHREGLVLTDDKRLLNWSLVPDYPYILQTIEPEYGYVQATVEAQLRPDLLLTSGSYAAAQNAGRKVCAYKLNAGLKVLWCEVPAIADDSHHIHLDLAPMAMGAGRLFFGYEQQLIVYDLETGSVEQTKNVFGTDCGFNSDQVVVALDFWQGSLWAVLSRYNAQAGQCYGDDNYYSVVEFSAELGMLGQAKDFATFIGDYHHPPADFGYGLTVSGGVAYAGLYDLHAVDLSSGKLKWSGYIYQDNFSVGPDGVYAGVGGQLKGLSLETGEELWSIGASFHATHPVNLDGYVYSDLWDGVVGKVDAATGEPVWQAVFNTWVNQGPNGGLVVLGDRVYFTRSGVLFALREGHPVGAPYCDGEWQSSYKGDPWLDELDE